MSAGNPRPGRTRSAFLGPGVFAAAVLALGAVVLVGTSGIPSRAGYGPVGPRFFPLAVALGLLVMGGILLRSTLRPDAYLGEKAASEKAATHWPTVGLLLAVLLVYGFLLDPLGYVFATALFFPAAAWVLGSRRPREAIRNLAIGLVVGAVVFFGFTELLGVRLPDGLLDPFL
ncbi:hypothetical protein Rxycam_01956 [Rubrobacter xylanophilus DSM 9941]|uniref:tripartite tricarboxylate transporter TctB family protein n=1 Tax=Rubrobacter xylanophilus TaxID=49319 RepID=UPI001C63BB56|nr:tripartite tricarboxylate transporter TctB family protein [Rubrobacter xylanophilus]QYJ16125.1 hypothetical protein Rxycam_01956 [Rubrobacter xylanophilus DSM 9941]